MFRSHRLTAFLALFALLMGNVGGWLHIHQHAEGIQGCVHHHVDGLHDHVHESGTCQSGTHGLAVTRCDGDVDPPLCADSACSTGRSGDCHSGHSHEVASDTSANSNGQQDDADSPRPAPTPAHDSDHCAVCQLMFTLRDGAFLVESLPTAWCDQHTQRTFLPPPAVDLGRRCVSAISVRGPPIA